MRLLRSPARGAEAALLLLATLLYLFTLDNGLQPYELLGGDLITHHYAQAEARFANAPGYPLYSMGGWLWYRTLHAFAVQTGTPYPNPIPLLSSYSTLWAVLALWLLYRLLLRYTRSPEYPTGNWPVAWLLTAYFGATYFFWYYATTSEQYSSAVAQTLAILYIYHRWADQLAPVRSRINENRTGDNPWLYALAFVCGLSLAHMLTVAFIVPPLVAVVLHQSPRLLRAPLTIVRAVVAAALPLLSYLFVYIRGDQNPQWRGQGDWESTRAWFWSFVATGQGQEELGWGFAPGAPFFGNGFPELMWQELSVPLLILGIVGLFWLPQRVRAILIPTLLIYLAFCWAYRLGNWFQVILPAYPLLLLGAGALLHRVPQHLTRRFGRNRIIGPVQPQALRMGILILLLVLLVWRINASLPAANSRNRHHDTALDRAAALLDTRLPMGAHIFASVDDTLALQYLTRIWNIRPDLILTGRDAAQAVLAQEGALYVTETAIDLLLAEIEPSGVSAPWMLAVDAPLPAWYRLQRAKDANATAEQSPNTPGETSGAPALTRLDRDLGNGLHLTAYSPFEPLLGTAYASSHATAGTNTIPLDVYLLWQIPGEADGSPAWPAGLNISVRLLDSQGQILNAVHGPGSVESTSEPATSSEPPRAIVDRPGPAPLLPTSSQPAVASAAVEVVAARTTGRDTAYFADPYRFYLSADQLPALTSIDVVLYRAVDGTFENIEILNLPIQ